MALEHLIAFRNFYDQLGILDGYALADFGIQPDMITGTFFPKNIKRVLDACAANPMLHPISFKDSWTFNRIVPEAMCGIGNGDPNPTLEFFSRPTTQPERKIILANFLASTKGTKLDKYDRALLHLYQAAAAGEDLEKVGVMTRMLQGKAHSRQFPGC